MLYTTLLRGVFRVAFGPLPEGPGAEEARGLVLVADGIGGLDLCATGLRHMAARAGLGYEARVVRWGHGFGRWLRDLTDAANVAARAQEVAREVAAFGARRPGVPVFLVGKSGGCGVMLGALERLPDGAVETAVLIAPAVSPGYDLRRALRAVRRELVVFWSPLDVVLLGLGTRLFGTIDRVRGPSAGLVGFRGPEGASGADPGYARLRQVRWGWRMARTGYLGGHVGVDSPFFLNDHVIPLLRDDPSRGRAGGPWAGSSPGRAGPIR